MGPAVSLSLSLSLLLSLSCRVHDPETRYVPASPDSTGPGLMWNGKEAAFTFSSDDNNVCNVGWAEVFIESGVRFTIFTVPRWIGSGGHLQLGQLQSLAESGFEIGSHTMTHAHLTQLDDFHLHWELSASRDTLERLIHSPAYKCISFAYPFNEHDDRVMAVAAQYCLAARDGGMGQPPNFTRGRADWDTVAVFEVPRIITIGMLVHENKFNEEETREAVKSRLADWKRHHRWVNVMAHSQGDCDTTHIRWILEELRGDGEIWIAPFGEVARYWLCHRQYVPSSVP